MKIKSADTILINGRFLTMENEGEMAEAVAIENGRIVYVGNEEKARVFADRDTEIIDLGGRVAAPGLIDCHTHPMSSYAPRFSWLDLSGKNTASLETLLNCLKDAAKKTPKGGWIVGRGYDESKFAEGAIPLCAAMLDEATTDHMVLLSRTCGHIGVVNTRAMERCGFTDASVPPTGGGHFFKDENGRLTGMISGAVLGLVPVPALTDEQRKNGMVEGVQKEYFSKGITATGEMGSRAISFRMLQQLESEGRLKLRVGFYFAGRRRAGEESVAKKMQDLGLLAGFGSEHLKILGIKFVMDGSTGGHTAAFSQPYLGEPNNYGELYCDEQDLFEDVLKSAKAGLQISIHAIGDRAIEMALRSIEYANENGADTTKLRVRLEHLESPTPDQIERIKRLNIAVGLSSAFIYSLGDSHISALGYDRLVDAFPAKTLIENGIPVGCNSDCPVCPVNPMLGVYSMVTRTTEAGQSFGGTKQAVDRISALRAYTKDAAYLICAERDLGSLCVGKLADLVVFDEDYLSVPDQALKDVSVYMTISGGEVVYKK